MNTPFSVQATGATFRSGGRGPNQLRPLTLTPGFVQTAEGSVLVALGNTRVLDLRHHRTGSARLAAQLRARLGHGGVLHAAPLHRHADAARKRARQDRRPHARDSAPDRPEPALCCRYAGSGRAHGDPRLRRDSGRRRHAHGGHHRRGRGSGAGAQCPGQGRNAEALAAEAAGGGNIGRHRGRRSRCSISATKRTRRPRWT